jgi:hypothetical protein
VCMCVCVLTLLVFVTVVRGDCWIAMSYCFCGWQWRKHIIDQHYILGRAYTMTKNMTAAATASGIDSSPDPHVSGYMVSPNLTRFTPAAHGPPIIRYGAPRRRDASPRTDIFAFMGLSKASQICGGLQRAIRRPKLARSPP